MYLLRDFLISCFFCLFVGEELENYYKMTEEELSKRKANKGGRSGGRGGRGGRGGGRGRGGRRNDNRYGKRRRDEGGDGPKQESAVEQKKGEHVRFDSEEKKSEDTCSPVKKMKAEE